MKLDLGEKRGLRDSPVDTRRDRPGPEPWPDGRHHTPHGAQTRKENTLKIQKITSQNRRDFTVVYECEHCGATKTGYGYDDDNFHRQVIPGMKCEQCGKTAGDDYRPMGTRYAEHEVV